MRPLELRLQQLWQRLSALILHIRDRGFELSDGSWRSRLLEPMRDAAQVRWRLEERQQLLLQARKQLAARGTRRRDANRERLSVQ